MGSVRVWFDPELHTMVRFELGSKVRGSVEMVVNWPDKVRSWFDYNIQSSTTPTSG